MAKKDKGMSKEDHYKIVKKRAQKATKERGHYDSYNSEEELRVREKGDAKRRAKKRKIKGALNK